MSNEKIAGRLLFLDVYNLTVQRPHTIALQTSLILGHPLYLSPAMPHCYMYVCCEVVPPETLRPFVFHVKACCVMLDVGFQSA